MRKAARVVLGVIGGAIIGNLVATIATFGIDASYGAEVTGGNWHMSLPNVVYGVIIGLCVGFFAALTAKWKGWIVGATAQILPGLLMLCLSVFFTGPSLSRYGASPWVWMLVGLVPALIGGALADEAISNEDFSKEMKSIRFHWLWLWIPLAVFFSDLAGSIRFVLNAFMIEWQIIFHPRMWIIGVIALPLIVGVLYMTYSLPVTGICSLLSLYSAQQDKTSRPSGGGRAFLTLAICVGIPLATAFVWYLCGLCLGFFSNAGFKIY